MKRASLIFAASIATLGLVVHLVDAQFSPPSAPPPTGGPTVIHNIALSAAAQAASINVTGGIRTDGCMGATYAGVTGAIANVNVGGYKAANALCNSAFSGSHVCRVEEVMESIRCGVTLPSGTNGWVNGGPPGFTAPANDCAGWTNSATGYGRFWQFDGTTGGSGTMTPCPTSTLPYACCK